METCQPLTILPLVEITQNPVAVLGDTVNITCTIRDFNVTEVTFLASGNNTLLTFYTNTSTIASNQTGMAMFVNNSDVTEWQAILSIRNVTCSLGGNYTCRVLGKSGGIHSKSTTLRVRRKLKLFVIESSSWKGRIKQKIEVKKRAFCWLFR